MEAGIPEEFGEPFRDALTKLQAERRRCRPTKVHAVLDQQLGTKWRERFREFDDTPAAAASIGQVHRAVWSDGRDVAVKVQYPGADHALRADLKTLGAHVRPHPEALPGTDVKAMVDELIDRTDAELDYLGEAEHQRAFAKAFDSDPNSSRAQGRGQRTEGRGVRMGERHPAVAPDHRGQPGGRNAAAARMAEFSFVALPGRLAARRPAPGQLLHRRRRPLASSTSVPSASTPMGLPPETGPIFKLARDRSYDELRDLLRLRT